MQRLIGNFNSVASTVPSLSSLYSILKKAEIYKEEIDKGKTFSVLKNLLFIKIFHFRI